jgi:hypothetical protein
MKLKIFLLTVLLSLTGCATVAPVVTKTKYVDQPEIGLIKREELGNTLLEYYVSNTQPSIRVIENWGINSRLKNYAPQVLRPIGVGEKVSRFYVDIAPPDTPDMFRRVCFDPSDSIFFIPNGLDICDFVGKAIVNSGIVRIEAADYIDIRLPQFKQELIFNGKSGSSLKFLYREIKGDFLRAPFSQEIQYDLSEGNIVGFKGARLEILSSSNSYIEYKVLRSFNR